jgi:hypothetical protein
MVRVLHNNIGHHLISKMIDMSKFILIYKDTFLLKPRTHWGRNTVGGSLFLFLCGLSIQRDSLRLPTINGPAFQFTVSELVPEFKAASTSNSEFAIKPIVISPKATGTIPKASSSNYSRRSLEYLVRQI